MTLPPAAWELDVGRLCAALEDKRLSLRLTHYQMAARLGVGYPTYNIWRYRGTSMHGDAAVRVALFLGIDLREFTRERTGPIPEYRGNRP